MEKSNVVKLEIGKSYQLDVDSENSHIIVNGALINRKVIEQLNFIQLDKEGCLNHFNNDGYKDIAVDFAEIFSYLVYSAEYTGETEKVMELLLSLRYQLKRIKDFSFPDELIKEFRRFQ